MFPKSIVPMETANFMLLFLDSLLTYSTQLYFKEKGKSCDRSCDMTCYNVGNLVTSEMMATHVHVQMYICVHVHKFYMYKKNVYSMYIVHV